MRTPFSMTAKCAKDIVRYRVFEITERGRQLLTEKPTTIDSKFLERYEEFNAFRAKSSKDETPEEHVENPAFSTPEEALEYGFLRLTENLADDIIRKIMSCSPAFFERLVVELMVKMGYGGSLREAAQIVGKAGDGGIDVIIKEDKLGLDVIYIQAKRWEGTVGRPEIQKFAGALLGQKARKGIFITTSNFTKEAREYAQNLEAKLILIDGERLADLMIQYGLGVSTTMVYEIKKVDSDYFNED
jgi:restriction system protein